MASNNVFKYNKTSITRDEHVDSVMGKILSGTSDEWKEWKKFIKKDKDLPRYLKEAVTELVKYYEASDRQKVLPSQANQILAALNYCKPEEVKVIIIGQDPARGYCKGQPLATGLAFSYPQGITEVDVKNNIKEYKEKNPHSDLEPGRSVLDVHKALIKAEFEPGKSCCHEHWARRGVLLLNACLTIDPDNGTERRSRSGKKENPHFKHWEGFIYNLLLRLLQKIDIKCKKFHPVYVLCWGTHARDVGRDLKEELGSRGEWDDDHAGLLNPPPVIFIGHHPTYPTGAEKKFIEQATNQFKLIMEYKSYETLFDQETEDEEEEEE